jgi:hypothetical protein
VSNASIGYIRSARFPSEEKPRIFAPGAAMWRKKPPQPHSDTFDDYPPRHQADNLHIMVIDYPDPKREPSPVPHDVLAWARELGIWVYASNYTPGQGGLLRVQWRNSQVKDFQGTNGMIFEALRGDWQEHNPSGE